MYVDIGTVRPGTTLFVPFHTFDSNDPSASVTITGLATTDIEVYKDASMTQRASDSGYALVDTDGIDIDTTTGIHGVTIDLSDNTTAGFWAAGSDYVVIIASITVDAATINFIPIRFRIGYAGAVLNTTIATLATQTSFTLTSGPAEDDALNGMWVWIHDVASAVQCGYGVVSDYTGSTKTVTLAAGTTFAAAATDNISVMGPMPMQPTVAGSQSVVQTGDSFARLGAPAGASVSADIATVDTVVDSILVDTAEIGTAGAGLTALATQASVNTIDGIVDAILVDTGTTLETHLTDIKGGTFSGATDSLEAIRDRGDAAWTTGAGGTPPQLLQSTTIATLATQTSFTLTAGSADNDAYNGAIAVVTDQSTATQKAVGTVSDYVGSTKTITLSADPAIFTMAVGDTIEIIAALGSAGSAPTAAAIADAVLAEAVTDHSGTAGSLAEYVAGILTDTAEIGAAGAGLTEAGGTGDQFTAIPWNASWDTEVQSECADALTAYDPPTNTEMTSAFTEIKGATWSAATDTIEHIRNKQTDIETDTQDIQTQIGTAGAGLTNINLPNQTMNITGNITGNLSGSVGSVTGAVGSVTGNVGGNVVGSVASVTGAVGSVTGNVGGNVTGSVGSLSATAKTEVNAEVVDVLATDTHAEVGQGAPPATASYKQMLQYLYKNWRNKRTQTATTESLYDDAGTTVDQKRTVSDDGTTATKGEIGTGP